MQTVGKVVQQVIRNVLERNSIRTAHLVEMKNTLMLMTHQFVKVFTRNQRKQNLNPTVNPTVNLKIIMMETQLKMITMERQLQIF